MSCKFQSELESAVIGVSVFRVFASGKRWHGPDLLWFEHTAGGTGYQLGAHHTLLDGLLRFLFGGFSDFGIGFEALRLSWVLPVPSVLLARARRHKARASSRWHGLLTVARLPSRGSFLGAGSCCVFLARARRHSS